MSLFRLDPRRARDIARQHGTPCYVQDLSIVRAQYRRLRAALPEWCEVFYAVKANPHPEVVGALRKEGAGLEVASMGELKLARAAGAAGRGIAFAGPAKRDDELVAALEEGVVLAVESANELMRADRLAGDRGITANVSVRVNPPWGVEEEILILGATQPSQFGVDLEALPELFDWARPCAHVRVTGLHVFSATNVLDAKALADNAARVFDLAKSIWRDHGVVMTTIDVGGGLGIPYRPDQRQLDVEALGRMLGEVGERAFDGRKPRVIVEPGRFLVGEAGTFLTRVVDVKSCRGKHYVVCDGGINALLRPALIRQAHPTAIVGKESHPAVGVFDVVGPLCTTLDALGRDVALPAAEPGDLVAIACAGAYGFTEAMPLFLSRPETAHVIIDG